MVKSNQNNKKNIKSAKKRSKAVNEKSRNSKWKKQRDKERKEKKRRRIRFTVEGQDPEETQRRIEQLPLSMQPVECGGVIYGFGNLARFLMCPGNYESLNKGLLAELNAEAESDGRK